MLWKWKQSMKMCLCLWVFLFHTSQLGLSVRMAESCLILLCKPHIYHKYTKTDTLNCICGAFFIGKILFYRYFLRRKKNEKIFLSHTHTRTHTQNRRRAYYRVCQCVWNIVRPSVCVRAHPNAIHLISQASVEHSFRIVWHPIHGSNTQISSNLFSYFFFYFSTIYASLYKHTSIHM